MDEQALGKEMLQYFRSSGADGQEEFPSFVRFACRAGTDMQTLRAYREKNGVFAAAWRECEEILADRITDGALRKKLDASFAKFLLSARFGYTDKEEEKGMDGMEIIVTVKEPGKT